MAEVLSRGRSGRARILPVTLIIASALIQAAQSLTLRPEAGKITEQQVDAEADRMFAEKGYHKWIGNNHYYKAVHLTSPITWHKASEAAKAEGGYLATVNSAKENTFILRLLKDHRLWNRTVGPWIGGYRKQAGGNAKHGWQWVSREHWRYDGWEYNQPDYDYEHYLHYSRLHEIGWNNLEADDPRVMSYIIEVDPPLKDPPK